MVLIAIDRLLQVVQIAFLTHGVALVAGTDQENVTPACVTPLQILTNCCVWVLSCIRCMVTTIPALSVCRLANKHHN